MVMFRSLESDEWPPTDQNCMIVTELTPCTFEILDTSQKETEFGLVKNTGSLEYPLAIVKQIAAVRAEDAGVDLVYCKVLKDP